MGSGSILALVPDLMFGVRVRDVLRQLGYAATVVEDAGAAHQHLSAELALVIIDLRAEAAGWQALISAARQLNPTPPILAFGSHIDTSRLQLARAAGCDKIVANSAFSANLPALVQELAGPPARGGDCAAGP